MKENFSCSDQLFPFLRYAHYFTIEEDSIFQDVVCLDCRIFYVAQGVGTIKIDNVYYPVKKGTLLFWPAGTKYSLLPNHETPFWLYGLNFDLDRKRAHLSQPIPPCPYTESKQIILEKVYIEDMASLNNSVVLEDGSFTEAILAEIHSEYLLKRTFFQPKMDHLLAGLLLDICRNARFQADHGSLAQLNQAEEILLYIHDYYWKQLSNRDIAEVFHFHPSYLNELILKRTGYSLHQYLLRYRLSIALNLLQTTADSVTSIARKVGFANSNYFSRYFKKVYGKKPSDFRHQNGSKNM